MSGLSISRLLGLGTSRKRKTPQENRGSITLLSELKQTLQIDQLLDALEVPYTLEEESEEGVENEGKEAQLGFIQFKDLNLEMLSAEVNSNGSDADEEIKVNLLPLRNYLIGRSKGSGSTKSAFTFLATFEYPAEVCFSIEVDTDLGKKLCQFLKTPSITAWLSIERIQREMSVPRELLELMERSGFNLHRNAANESLKIKKEFQFQTGSQQQGSLVNLQDVIKSNESDAESDEDEPKRIIIPLSKYNMEFALIPSTSSFQKQWDRPGDGIPLDQLKEQARNPAIERKTLTLEYSVGFTFENVPKLSLPKLKLNPDSIGKGLFNLDSSTKDLTIIANNKAEIKCHRIVLMVHSAPLRAMLFPTNKMLEGETGRIEMLENSADGIKRFIRFLYGFEISKAHLSPDMAVELLLLSHKYQVKKLEEFLKDFLSSKSKKWFSVDALLELYFGVRNVDSLEELTTHCLIELAKIPNETFKSCEYYKKLSIQESTALFSKFLEWR